MASWNDDEDSSNEDEFESQEGNSGIIFLIDTKQSMFTKDVEDGDSKELSRFNLALKCCRVQMLNKIIAKQKDLVGVVLFGTANSDPKTQFKHVSLLLELNYPGATAIKRLDQLLDDADSKEIQSEYGSSDEFLLSEALWFCSSLLSQSRTQLAEKRIILFTDDCNPHEYHADRAHKARTRAKDLKKVQITLEIVPIGGPDFDYGVFYKELVETVNGCPDCDENDPDPALRLEQLLERVNRLEFRRRRYAKIKWNLGNDVVLGVSLYTLYREAIVLPAQPLSRATNEPVSRVQQIYDQATGELLLPSDIVEFLSIGGSDVVFTREEKEVLSKVMEPGLVLLGFKPSSVVTEGLHCGQPSFLFPEDTLIKGSRKLMKALVERCIAKRKVAVCCMTPRYRAVTKYFYLVPSEETYQDGLQVSACGFHALPIPFDSEIRPQEFDYSSHISTSTLELVQRVVNKLKMSYKPSDFQNPKLQLFWGHLEALALDYSASTEVEDSTVPDENAQTARLGILASEFNHIFHLDGIPTPVNKRETKSREFASASKKPKLDSKEFDINLDVDIREAIKTKKVERFTVSQLKEFLSDNNIKTTNLKKKADLVNAVYSMKS